MHQVIVWNTQICLSICGYFRSLGRLLSCLIYIYIYMHACMHAFRSVSPNSRVCTKINKLPYIHIYIHIYMHACILCPAGSIHPNSHVSSNIGSILTSLHIYLPAWISYPAGSICPNSHVSSNMGRLPYCLTRTFTSHACMHACMYTLHRSQHSPQVSPSHMSSTWAGCLTASHAHLHCMHAQHAKLAVLFWVSDCEQAWYIHTL